MKFVDEVIIDAKAGNGGNGVVAWRREKFVPKGGPAGGDGGNGGNVVFVADANMNSLLDFRFKPRWYAQHGANGMGGSKDGPWGDDLVILVPVGTEILDESGEELLADMNENGKKAVVLKGGSGGWGNTHFATSSRQAPEFANAGLPGEERKLKLSLKLLADVGLVGFPNAGKSTLLSTISAARPKIADYPFTTLNPQLGVVKIQQGESFVVADVPGLIKGASEGMGLGVRFLKHLERVKTLCHLIEPELNFEACHEDVLIDRYSEIRHELENFGDKLAELPEIVVLTKADLCKQASELTLKQIEVFKAFLKQKNIPIYEISAQTHEQLKELKLALWRDVKKA